jgi:hypothetical protein
MKYRYTLNGDAQPNESPGENADDLTPLGHFVYLCKIFLR